MLFYEIKLNGVDITNSVSIGAIVREKLAEPMDDGSIHLPLSFVDIEYEMKGLLEISIEEDDLVRNYEFLIINDDVNEGSKYGEYKHDLTVMEYSGKYDDYIISSFASTKTLKEEGLAPFTYNSYNLNRPTTPDGRTFGFIQNLHLPPIKVDRIYYTNEPIVIEDVEEAFQMLDVVTLSATYKRTPVFLKAIKDGETPQRIVLSEEPSNFILSKGEWTLQYGIYNTVDYQYHDGSLEVPLNEDVAFYEYHIRVVDRKDISIYDLLQRISDMKSKFGGIESKLYYYSTRLFEIDDDIADYLKSVEAPQMYFQKLTVRQAVNTVFSYVNAISRFKRDEDGAIDKLSMDEFNKITGIFDFDEGVSSYTTQRSGSELALKGVSFLERSMPNDLDEPTIETPANDMFKTVRASGIQMTQDNFELKLERPIYQPKKLETYLQDVLVSYQIDMNPNSKSLYSQEDLILDLTNRWINVEKWKLKEVTTDFPNIHFEYPFTENVGLIKNRVETIYWQEGDTSIKMSDLFGQVWKSNLIVNVIRSAFLEHFTRNPPRPYLYNDGYDDLMATYYEVEFPAAESGTLEPFYTNWLMLEGLLFNVEYISLEDIVVDFDRKDLDDNYNYYSEAKVNQTDKLIAVGLATRGMSGDIQRSGTRNMIVSQYHDKLEEILKVGMYNPEHRLTIAELKLNLQNEFIGATYMLSKDFNRSQMFRALMQEYRWSEIPTSRQIHDRHEIYKDYLIVERPDKNNVMFEITKMRSGTSKIIFDILNNMEYLDKTKITYAFVRTDGSVELYDTHETKSAIYAPVSSFGIKDGLSFSFGFDSNLIAGDGIKIIDEIYYNNAIRYTDLDGMFTKFWFSLKQNHELVTEAEELMNYPLLLESPVGFNDLMEGLIDSGSPDFEDSGSDYLIWNKDSRQNAKLSYQVSILPDEHNLYIFGQAFFSNNYLVKNRDENGGTPKYLYIYDNEEDYEFLRYGIFDDLKIKHGYDEENVIELDYTNSYIYYDGNKLKFRFTDNEILNKISNATHWAIGDINHNLYVACNENLGGFDVVERHIRNDIQEIGEYGIIYVLIPKISTSIHIEANISYNIGLQHSIKEDIILGSDVDVNPILGRYINAFIMAELSLSYNLGFQYSIDVTIIIGTEIDAEKPPKPKPEETPLPPTSYSISATSITLTAISGMLYKMDNGEWQEEETFSPLEPNSQHLFYQRLAETDTHAESDPSVGAAFTTLKGDQLAPSVPIVDEVTHNSIELIAITNPATGISGEYRIGATGTWQSNKKLTKDANGNDLQYNTTYNVYQRYKESNQYNPSPPSIGLNFKTKKMPQYAPENPSYLSRTPSKIVLNAISNNPVSNASVEYKEGLHGTWQNSTTFDGLNHLTRYTFYARYKETAHYEASPLSSANIYTLDKLTQPIPPNAPSYSSKTTSSITLVNLGSNVEYRINNGTWTKDRYFDGLNVGQSYKFEARYEETPDLYPSNPSDEAYIETSKYTQSKPSNPPSLDEAKPYAIHLNMTPPNPVSGLYCEYRIGTSGSWQDSIILTKDGLGNNLTPNTSYNVYQRYKGSSQYEPSPPSNALSVTTDRAVQSRIPSTPTYYSKTHNQIILNSSTPNPNPDTGASIEYSRDGVTWQDSTTFSGLVASTSYTFYARYKQTAIYYASGSSSASISTDPTPIPKLNAPTVAFISGGDYCGEAIISVSHNNNVQVDVVYDGNVIGQIEANRGANFMIEHNVGVGQTIYINIKLQASGYITSNNGSTSATVPICTPRP